MRIKSLFRNATVALALVGMIATPTVYAAGSGTARMKSAPAVVATDVSLSAGGVLVGQVVDSQGAPQAQQQVRVLHQGQLVASAMTNEAGRFTVRDLRGGVHQIETVNGGSICRLWAPQTAPPAAQQAAVVVTGKDVVRGQSDGEYGPAIRGAIVGGLLGAGLVGILDYNSAS